GILASRTSIKVVEAEHGTKVVPDQAYVIKPNTDVALTDGVLSVTPRHDDRRPHYPIDHFLRSLATVQGPRAIGVVLSGTGSDGTLGLCEIKAAGGLTFAQDESTAQHGGMPQSAIASGAVDLVLPPEQIATRLVDLRTHPLLQSPNGEDTFEPKAQNEFQRVIAALRTTSGVDFSQYRDTTLKRRTARRMILRGFQSPADYAKFIERDPDEAEALYRDVLINVTSFFRDPGMFEELKQTVFPGIVRRQSQSQVFRVWVPGCSTGQEAYSVAIALLEFLGEEGIKRDVQVFATDVGDRLALETARAGVYPESIESEVSPERLRRFFTKDEHTYRIQKAVRELCVFARQNVTVDPPFSRVDLITCRNVLIYMSSPLQERLLPTFHFALSPGGYLVLGSAESVGSSTDLFELVSRPHKIYRRKEHGRRPQLTFAVDEWLNGAGTRPLTHGGVAGDIQREVDRVTLSHYTPPGVVVDSRFNIQQIRGRIEPFLTASEGHAAVNVLRAAPEGVLEPLQHALAEAKSSKSPAVREHLTFTAGDRDMEFTIRVLPLTAPRPDGTWFLIVFETQTASWSFPSVPALDPASADANLIRLRHELAATKQYVQSILDNQDVSTQELRVAHEEVLSSNEELQSTNEELETTKEELQSSNEELITLNEQFENRNRELDILADDLSNFIGSADVPMVTVGRDLRIRRMTPAAQRAFNLLPTDVGRSIEHIKFSVGVSNVVGIIDNVVTSMQPWEREVTDKDGRWWLIRVRPYVTGDNRIDGATLVAVDIDSIQRTRELTEARDYALAVVQTVRGPLVVLDGECRVGLANAAFYRLFGDDPAVLEGRRLWEARGSIWNDPDLRRHLTEACSGRESVSDLEIVRHIPPIGDRVLVLNARAITREGRPSVLLLAIEDVTDARQAERLRVDAETLRLVDRRKDEFLGVLAHELRNPLAPMRFAIEVLKQADGKQDAGRAREVIERQIGHLVRLIDDLLDVSRIALGKIELQFEPVDLREVVASAVELTRPAIDSAHHALTVSVPDAPLVVKGDPVRLTQILVNLLNNAVKFTPPAGHIWLIAERAGEEFETEDVVRIRVRDTGIGIAADQRHRVFEMFVQGDRSLERSRGGLGVGLTLVRNLAAMHGGTVEARSDGPNRGSEFIVTLQLQPAERPVPGPAEAPRSRKGRQFRILVADDNDDGREMLAFLLQREGHVVATAVDGQAALDQVSEFHPDVAVLDLTMPGVSGFDVARRLRKDNATAPFLVALSGLGQKEDKARAIEAGFDYHFTKPVDVHVLLSLFNEKVAK
ncbi:MAG TPA: CheR family methyltransferase, partial [Vicinamibacterales bacterium]|nr:CheR family methyltransferase [Vicinamibacterales bacterium]